MTRLCPRCKLEKPLSDFPTKRSGKRQGYCRPCHAEYNALWYKNNGRRAADNHRRVCRRTTLHVSGRMIGGLHKRPYTGYCEICGVKREMRLHYHHWDDQNPSRGVWVCAYCHRLVEFYEKNLMYKYIHKYVIRKYQVNETVEADNL